MFVFIALFSTILNSAIAQVQFAEFSFDKRIQKVPHTQEGEPLQWSYHFTNTGEIPLVISNYHVECTCTRVEYPSEPILPGESADILVTFDTKGKIGWQYRTVQLYANTKSGVEEIEFRVKILND